MASSATSSQKPFTATESVTKELCTVCKKKIEGKALSADGSYYHYGCFKCITCGEALKTRFHSVAKKPYCRKCYLQQFAPKCFGCQQPFDGTMSVQMLGNDYHERCLKCAQCFKSLAGGQYFPVNDKAYCLQCHWEVRLASMGLQQKGT